MVVTREWMMRFMGLAAVDRIRIAKCLSVSSAKLDATTLARRVFATAANLGKVDTLCKAIARLEVRH